jgi:hypothetical protein
MTIRLRIAFLTIFLLTPTILAAQDATDRAARVAAARGFLKSSGAVDAMAPIGRRLVAVQPLLIAESSAIGQRWGARLGEEIAKELVR